MYHSSRWGGWSFELATRNDTDHSLTFACADPEHDMTFPCRRDGSPAVVQGGWQEARGGSIEAQYTKPSLNNSYFVENIKEELDVEGEWFFAKKEGAHGVLYFAPPKAFASRAALKTYALVATDVANVVEVKGDDVVEGDDVERMAPRPLASLVRHVHFENVTFAHAALTVLRPYETPSGGDWAIHRGAALFADGALDFHIVGCLYDQVDGNAIFFSRHVRNSSVVGNAFRDVGETAILLVGASGAHRTNAAAHDDYPAYNTITQNHVANVGVWNKQSAAYVVVLSGLSTMSFGMYVLQLTCVLFFLLVSTYNCTTGTSKPLRARTLYAQTSFTMVLDQALILTTARLAVRSWTPTLSSTTCASLTTTGRSTGACRTHAHTSAIRCCSHLSVSCPSSSHPSLLLISWDRQPYVYRLNESDPSLKPHASGAPRLAISPITQFITRNLVINFNFLGGACGSIAIDFDDESSQYSVQRNVLLYGGTKTYATDRASLTSPTLPYYFSYLTLSPAPPPHYTHTPPGLMAWIETYHTTSLYSPLRRPSRDPRATTRSRRRAIFPPPTRISLRTTACSARQTIRASMLLCPNCVCVCGPQCG